MPVLNRPNRLTFCLFVTSILCFCFASPALADDSREVPPYAVEQFKQLASLDEEIETSLKALWGADFPWMVAINTVKRAYQRDREANEQLRLRRLDWLLANRHHIGLKPRLRLEKSLLGRAVRSDWVEDAKRLIDAGVNPYRTYARGGRTELRSAKSNAMLAALLAKPPHSVEAEFALANFMANGDSADIKIERLKQLQSLQLSYDLPRCGWAKAVRKQFAAYVPEGESLDLVLPAKLDFNPWSCDVAEYEYMIDRMLAAIIWYPDRRVAEWLLATAPDEFLLNRSPNGSDMFSKPGGERADRLLSRHGESLLNAAIAWPRPKVVKHLLQLHADPLQKLAHGRSPANVALAAGEHELFMQIIQGRESELHRVKRSPLLLAALQADNRDLLEHIRDNGIDLRSPIRIEGHPICGSCGESFSNDRVTIRCNSICELSPLGAAVRIGAKNSLIVLTDASPERLQGKPLHTLLEQSANEATKQQLKDLADPQSAINQQRFISTAPKSIDIARFRGLKLASGDKELEALLDSEDMPTLLANATSIQKATLFYRYALGLQKPWPAAEPVIAQHIDSASAYAAFVLQRRFPAAEASFAEQANYAVAYAVQTLNGRFEAGEAAIAKQARASVKYARQALRGRFIAGEAAIGANAATAFEYAFYVLKGPFPEGEVALAVDGSDAMRYANKILKGPFPAGEAAIAKDSHRAMRYASKILKGRFEAAEPTFAADPNLAYEYATRILKGRFPAGEAVIAEDAEKAFNYALLIKERFEAGEPALATNGSYALNYCRHVTKAPFPAAEAAIAAAGGQSAFRYASEILKGRFEAGEQAIVDSGLYFSYQYASQVLRGKFDAGHELLMNSSYADRYQQLVENSQ